MIKARIRKIAGRSFSIACTDHPTGSLLQTWPAGLFSTNEGDVFDAEQPDLCEDEEFNTLVRTEIGRLLWVQSIDLEFEPFTNKQGAQ